MLQLLQLLLLFCRCVAHAGGSLVVLTQNGGTGYGERSPRDVHGAGTALQL